MLYKHIIKPFFFLFDPEKVHGFVSLFIKFSFKIPGVAPLVRYYAGSNGKNEGFDLLNLHFKNRVGLAAGFDKNAELIDELSSFGFGFIEVGAVTPEPQSGNPKPRLFRLPHDKALVNRMGFNNKGVDYLIGKLKKRKSDIVVGVNLGKNTHTPNSKAADDYVLLFEKLFDFADYFVINVSCPNISDLRELQDKEALEKILLEIEKINNAKPNPKPVLLKVSPDLNDNQLDEVINLVKTTGIAGVVAVNTTVSRNGLKTSKTLVNAIGKGGLSGAPLKKRALEVVRYLKEKSEKKFPVIGVGGIFTADDANEMFAAGADLIQVFTGFVYEGPFIAKKLLK